MLQHHHNYDSTVIIIKSCSKNNCITEFAGKLNNWYVLVKKTIFNTVPSIPHIIMFFLQREMLFDL